MKRTVLFLFLLSVISLPVCAQKGFFKGLSRLRLKKVTVPAEPVLRGVQGKKFLPGARPALPAGALEMEKFVMRPLRLTDPAGLTLMFDPVSRMQEVQVLMRYKIVLGERFAAFKREMDPFLSYQLRPSSRRELHPSEKERILSRAAEMELELVRLGVSVSPKDPALSFAREYVTRIKNEVAPLLKGMDSDAPRFLRTDRTFDGTEFWLHQNEAKRWLSMFQHGQAVYLASKLPKNLRVAVLNDRPSVLKKMEASHKKGVFIRNGTLDCFSTADDLLASIRDLDRQYDLIITDIIVPGGGGYYITAELRLDGYDGAIIALSAFERDDSMGLDMFERGFDGMLNLPIGFEQSPFWEADVLRGLNRYFELRRARGWSR